MPTFDELRKIKDDQGKEIYDPKEKETNDVFLQKIIDYFLEYVYNQREDSFTGVSDLKGLKLTRFNDEGQEVH